MRKCMLEGGNCRCDFPDEFPENLRMALQCFTGEEEFEIIMALDNSMDDEVSLSRLRSLVGYDILDPLIKLQENGICKRTTNLKEDFYSLTYYGTTLLKKVLEAHLLYVGALNEDNVDFLGELPDEFFEFIEKVPDGIFIWIEKKHKCPTCERGKDYILWVDDTNCGEEGMENHHKFFKLFTDFEVDLYQEYNGTGKYKLDYQVISVTYPDKPKKHWLKVK